MSDEIDISEMLEIMKKANNDHNISEDLMIEYESTCNEYIDYFKSILESIEKERKYIKKLEDEREEQKKREEERKKKEPEKVVTEVLTLVNVAETSNISQLNLKKSVHINDIIHQIINVKQIEILERVKRRSVDDQMYFVDFEKNSRNVEGASTKYKALMGTFTILGTLNKQGVRSEYKVDLFNPEVYGSDKKIFNCDCPAHRFKSSQDNTVCKHIAFIMCCVVGYATVDFFKTFRLNKDEVAMIMDKMSVQRESIMMNVEVNRMKDGCNAIDDNLIIRKKILNKDSYLNSTRDVSEEDCPICFDVIEKDINRLNCPECKKHVHQECMEIWLSRNNSCVNCRSDKWKHYKKCFVENKNIELLE